MRHTSLIPGRNTRRVFLALAAAAALASRPAPAQPASEATLPPDIRAQVDSAATRVLASMGVPSISVAVVKSGQIAYLQAYGDARVGAGATPATPARPTMRYSIGSISKQFTATAVLMLAEEGKLSLDDKVAKYLPQLTRAHDVTIRQLLSHTSGYQDYWPQDYLPPFMLRDVTGETILDRWAGRPLDFEPGTQWQYSNTGFVAAGVIVEKAGGVPLLQLLRERVFVPLGMTSVVDVDREGLRDPDPIGYTRYALGPLRVARKEGKGWLFAAGELAMTAEDLARWDAAMADRRLLKPGSYDEMQASVKLASGASASYGLGVGVGAVAGHRALLHGGGVSGFVTHNIVFPDDHAAVVALTNTDAADAASSLTLKLSALLFESQDAATAAERRRMRGVLEALQHARIDRSQLSENASSYFSVDALQDFASSLGPLGAIDEFVQTTQNERGGMTFRAYRAGFGEKSVVVTVRVLPDGKIEQFQVGPAD
jgi:D-alanyl-D-alanine carboxypeptidase